jgi:hypothetical protein
MSRIQVLGKTANEVRRTRTAEMKLKARHPCVGREEQRGGGDGALRTCRSARSSREGACVKSCPGGYEDTGPVCVYRRQGGGNGP